MQYQWHTCGGVLVMSFDMFTVLVDEPAVRDVEYVFIDEAHLLKNPETERYIAFKKLRTNKRVGFTGTPLSNNAHEYLTMLAAVVPNYKTVLGFTDDFEATMIKKINSGQTTDASETAVREAQQWTQTVRNTLETTIVHHRGQNILLKSLPAKFETVLRCPLSSHTRAKCDAIVEKQFFKRINQQRQWVLPEKMVYALHLINQFRVRGHRCLLFTQFIDTVDALQQACPYAFRDNGQDVGTRPPVYMFGIPIV